MHYVVINEWATDGYVNQISVIGVRHTWAEANDLLCKQAWDEREIANDRNWEIYNDDDCEFNAGEEGNYDGNHTRLFIESTQY